jgi:hypothetical protein
VFHLDHALVIATEAACKLLPSLASSPRMTITSAPDTTAELPCDFLEFIAQRSGIEDAAAAALLGDFLIQYEPRFNAAVRGATRLVA